jgi:hypothetical protein
MSENGHRVAIIAVALVVIGTIGWFTLGDQPQIRQYNWYYDLNTGELFKPAEYGDQPQAAPSGDLNGAPAGTLAGVPALVVRLDGKRTILYLQMRKPGMKPDAPPGPRDIWVAEKPGEPGARPAWMSMETGVGKRIVEEAQTGLRGKEWDVDFP